MKNVSKLLGLIALIAIIGFSMTACDDEDKKEDNDPFKGTWVRQENGADAQKIVAASGSWRSYENVNGVWVENMRGIYTASGKEITAIIVEVNMGLYSPQPSTEQWVSYPEVPDGIKQQYMPTATMNGTVEGNKFTIMNVTFTKQSGSSSVGGNNGGDTPTTPVNPGGGGNQNQNSMFTLTGMPNDYNGKYAMFFAPDSSIYGVNSINVNNSGMSFKLIKISNGKVNLPMWVYDNDFVRYYGNDTVDGYIMIFNSENISDIRGMIDLRSFSSVVFSGGAATKTWNQGQIAQIDTGGQGSDYGDDYEVIEDYPSTK